MNRHIFWPLLLCITATAQESREQAVRTQLAKVLGTQEPGGQQPAARQRPIQRLIARMEEGHYSRGGPANDAYTELKALGPLAAGELYAALPSMGPFGLTAALDLLARIPDQRLTTALGALLESQDPTQQYAAAEAARKLPLDGVLPLLERMEQSSLPLVQLAGIELRARQGMAPAKLASALEPFASQRNSMILEAVLRIVSAHGQAKEPLLSILITVARTAAPGALRNQALGAWGDSCDSAAEDQGIALYDEFMVGGASTTLVVRVLWRGDLPWIRFAGHVLPTDFKVDTKQWGYRLQRREEFFAQLPDDALVTLARLGMKNQDISDFLLRRKNPVLAPAVMDALLKQTGNTPLCVAWLQDVAPELLLEHAGKLLEPSKVNYQAAMWFAGTSDPRPVVGAARLLGTRTQSPSMRGPLSAIVRKHSTPEHLDLFLELLTDPLPWGVDPKPLVDPIFTAMNRWMTPDLLPRLLEKILVLRPDSMGKAVNVAAEIATEVNKDSVLELLAKCRARWETSTYVGKITTSKIGDSMVRILASWPGDDITEEFLAMLDAPNGGQAYTVLRALGDKRVPPARRRAVLQRALESDGSLNVLHFSEVAQDPDLRRFITDHMIAGNPTDLGSGSVITFLNNCPAGDRLAVASHLLENTRDHSIRYRVVSGTLNALGNWIATEETVALIGKFVRDSELGIRRAAIQSLSRATTLRAVPFLLTALEDPDETNRNLATEALNRLKDLAEKRAYWQGKLKDK